jgi:hypothetical protein
VNSANQNADAAKNYNIALACDRDTRWTNFDHIYAAPDTCPLDSIATVYHGLDTVGPGEYARIAAALQADDLILGVGRIEALMTYALRLPAGMGVVIAKKLIRVTIDGPNNRCKQALISNHVWSKALAAWWGVAFGEN